LAQLLRLYKFPITNKSKVSNMEIKDWRSQIVTSKSEKLTAKDKSARKGAGWLFDENQAFWRLGVKQTFNEEL